jgi:hypothetical protein
MKRTQLNFAIDVAAFAAFLFLLTTGLLLRYQLPAGSGGLHATGVGRGAAERPVTLLWGWTRHDWGDLHYWIAGLLVAILAVHLVLHWKWIVGIVRGTRSEASGLRFGLGLASLLALLLLAAAPVLAPTESVTRGELQQQQHSAAETELRGSMTVREVAEATGLSVTELLESVELPADASPDERIGRLLRRHGLQMSDLRQPANSDESTSIQETEP